MKTIYSLITAIIFTASAANAQTKFSINDGTENVANNAIMTDAAKNNELKFEMGANGASIKWQTSNENNTSHFELQISDDNKTFTSIKKVAASDMTQWATNYEVKFRKTYIAAEKVYYRVKTVFTNGAEMYTAATAFAIANGTGVSYASIH